MSERRKNDYYPTASKLTLELINRIPLDRKTILEPCAGQNHIVDVLNTIPYAKVVGADIDPEMPTAKLLGKTYDARYSEVYEKFNPDWVVTNPPFNQAFEILRMAYEHSKVGVALLLRLSFLEPTFERGEWLANHPPNTLIVLPRYSFTEDGNTDSVTCAWMVWEHKKYDLFDIQIVSKGKKAKRD